MEYTESDFNQIVWLLLRLVDDLVDRIKPETKEEHLFIHEVQLTRDLLAKRHPYADKVGDIQDMEKLQDKIQKFIPRGWNLEEETPNGP